MPPASFGVAPPRAPSPHQGREVDGWSTGLALRPHEYLGKGRSLADVIRAAGPFRGEALYLLALGSAATMARLHLAGIAGLRLSPANVLIGPHGQAFFAPGPRDSEFPSRDVRDWADVIVFAATGRTAGRDGEEPDLDRLLPALRAVIDECRQPDPESRPTAVELVRILLGHSAAGTGASLEELLREAESRTRPYEPPPDEPAPASTSLWRKPAFFAGIAIGVSIVAVAAFAVVAISGQAAREPHWADVVSAVDRRTATFTQKGRDVAAGGRLSFDRDAATSYEMKLTCGNAPKPAKVSLVGDRGVVGGAPFDANRPGIEPCAQLHAPAVRRYSSPYTIKALLDAAGTDVSAAPAPGGGQEITGTAPAHRIRGEESTDDFGGFGGEGPVRFWLRVDGDGLPVRLKVQSTGRTEGPLTVETTYRDWRAFEAIKGEVSSG
ncbi:hypothetical protein [Nonomuraea sp. SYSU D8015]|uniref:hypothetical protein n=1 Tax=Nonomuraea sp. SYSU D8015 TaxID=2593644 RepID=UPI001661264B|nr:hypothetical protein [Nonomuraea sp. SYSU D8015]